MRTKARVKLTVRESERDHLIAHWIRKPRGDLRASAVQFGWQSRRLWLRRVLPFKSI